VDRWDLDILRDIDLRVSLARLELALLMDVRDELFEQVADQVNDAESGDLVCWQRHQVEAYLLGVEFAPILRDFLLLDDRTLQQPHPLEDVAM